MIDPIALSIFGVSLRWYGVFFSFGLAATWLAMRRLVAYTPNMTPADVDRGMFWISIGAVIGGRVGNQVFYSDQTVFERVRILFDLQDGGMSFHGGLIGVGVAIFFFSKADSLGWQLADVASCSAPIGLALGRIGKFLNQELFGPPTTSVLAVSVDGIRRHPTQLYEAAIEGVLLFLMLYVFIPRYIKYRMALPTSLFLICYSVIRFVLDFLRNEEFVAAGLRASLLLSVGTLFIGLAMFIYSTSLGTKTIPLSKD